MKSKAKKFLSTLLAFVTVFGIFAAMPMTVSAVDASVTVTENARSQEVAEGEKVTFRVNADFRSDENSGTLSKVYIGKSDSGYIIKGWWEITPKGSAAWTIYRTTYGEEVNELSLTLTATPELNGAQFRYVFTFYAGFEYFTTYIARYSFSPATLTVISAAPKIISQPVNKTAKKGESATFTVLATGTGGLYYRWYYWDRNTETWKWLNNYGTINSGNLSYSDADTNSLKVTNNGSASTAFYCKCVGRAN